MKKRHLFLLAAAAVLCAFLIAFCTGGEDIPMPEEILIYQNGAVQSLTRKDTAFSTVYSLIRMETDPVQEAAIDPDTVAEIQNALAVEFIYEDTQQICGRDCSRILFSLSGWTEGSAVLYRDGQYQSGTYACNISAKKLIEVME